MALGRTKIGRRQRAETFSDEQETVEPDRELESYLAALAPEEETETTGTGRSFGSSQVYQLRLPLMANERLKELAAQQGTSPEALARDWVMQHLADEDVRTQEPAWPQSDESRPERSQPSPGQHQQPAQYPPGDFGQPRSGQYPGQQYAGDLHAAPPPAAGRVPYGEPGDDPYRIEETDTEITIPGDQYRYY